MPIQLQALRSAAGRSHRVKVAASLSEARARHETTAFLCHSHRDEGLAKGLQVLLPENGCEIYIDWQDTAMPEKPNRITAEQIQAKIRELDWFLFLATPNSTRSRWCPWEIGFADAVKNHSNIFIVPTTDHTGVWYGNEYLQLYRQITEAASGDLAAFAAGQTTNGIFARNL